MGGPGFKVNFGEVESQKKEAYTLKQSVTIFVEQKSTVKLGLLVRYNQIKI